MPTRSSPTRRTSSSARSGCVARRSTHTHTPQPAAPRPAARGPHGPSPFVAPAAIPPPPQPSPPLCQALDPDNNGWLKLNKFRDLMQGVGDAPLADGELDAMLAALPRAKRTDEDGNEFEVVAYEDYVAMVAR
jgi:hypothetical protein